MATIQQIAAEFVQQYGNGRIEERDGEEGLLLDYIGEFIPFSDLGFNGIGFFRRSLFPDEETIADSDSDTAPDEPIDRQAIRALKHLLAVHDFHVKKAAEIARFIRDTDAFDAPTLLAIRLAHALNNTNEGLPGLSQNGLAKLARLENGAMPSGLDWRSAEAPPLPEEQDGPFWVWPTWPNRIIRKAGGRPARFDPETGYWIDPHDGVAFEATHYIALPKTPPLT